MPKASDFHFYDPTQEVSVACGELSHWQQAGATYFITYRLADSIPQSAMQRILAERDDWLAKNGIDATKDGWSSKLANLPEERVKLFRRTFAIAFENQID